MSRRSIGVVVVALSVVGCGDDGGRVSDSAGASTGMSSPSEPTTTAMTLGTTTDVPTGGTESDSQSASNSNSNSDTATDTDTTATTETTQDASTGGPETTGGVNLPPEIDSEPELKLLLEQQLGGNFEPNQIFLASSVTREIRVYDAETLGFIESFDHPLFAETVYNPRGMAFNSRGNLLVATASTFIEFSEIGVVYETYPKVAVEATENVIFDPLGNLYTTTATGGTDKLNQYAAADYAFIQTIPGPPGAGQYTGITFDDYRGLYLASQSDNKIHVAEASPDFMSFTWVSTLAGQGPAVRLEGIVFNRTGELVVAQANMLRYDPVQGTVIGSFNVPQNVWPVPVRVDNVGNIYTADFEDGNGSQSADIVRFDPEGENPLTINDPQLFGPFGLAISGTVLASDPPVLYSYQVTATDPENDPLTFALLVAPAGMTIGPESGLIQWFVTSKQIGQHDVTVEVSDTSGNTATQMFVLEIAAG